jgi:HAE1 family hydrophobic/amphiphilic exporter-1
MSVTIGAIRRPIAICMLFAALLILGLVAYSSLPAELNPQVDFPVVSVITSYGGVNPEEMETIITKPIEDAISGVPGLKEIDSNSQQGVSVIRCQFYFGTNLDAAASAVQEKVDSVQSVLPVGVQNPNVQKRDSNSAPVITIVMRGKSETSRQLRDLADNVVTQRLSQAPDVGDVSVTGGDQREIHVDVRRDRLSAYGMTITDLATAIQNADSNISIGYIQFGSTYAALRFLGEFASVDELKNLRVAVPSQNGTGGQTAVWLRDIATVTDSSLERTSESTLDGRDAVTITVQKTSDGNTLRAVQGTKDEIAALKKYLPSDIEFVITRDQSTVVKDNLNDVLVSLCLGAVLAMAIVYIFLQNLRATAIVAVAIPTCVITTFLPIRALGMTLNSMTLLGLSLAIGILIDDSIVVLENIVRHLHTGQPPAEAALNGRMEIGLAAVTLTAVDLVVFTPIAFMNGVIGEQFRSFGISISAAVILSLFVSFTLTPMLASRWLRKGDMMESSGEGESGFAAFLNRSYHRLERGYRRVLARLIRHPWAVFITGNALLIVVLVLIAPKLGFTFAPNQDQGLVQIAVTAPAGASLDYTNTIAKEVERRVNANAAIRGEVQNMVCVVGQSALGGTGAGSAGTQYATIQLSLYPRKAPLDYVTELFRRDPTRLRTQSDQDIAKRMRRMIQSIPGAKRIQATEVSGFGSGGAPLEVDVTGADLNQILTASKKIEDLFSATPGVYGADLSYQASQPQVQFRLDRTRAVQYGYNVNTVAPAVSAAMQGNVGAQYRDQTTGNQYNIRVEFTDLDRNSVYQLGKIPIAFRTSTAILLQDVANLSLGAGPVRVDRINRLREVAVTAYLLPGTNVGNVRSLLQPEVAKLAKTPDFGQVKYQWGGQARSINEELPYLIQALLLGPVLSYMLMATLFNNPLYPLSIMLTMPQALVGALLALLIAHQPLSIVSSIGIVMLNGIATKNAILLVDFTEILRSRGYRREDAILEAAPARLRPILMTSFCIVFATLPTALALGRGAGFRQPLGITVVGGVIVSTFLTLLVIPCTYIIFDNLTQWIRSHYGHGRLNREA